MLFLNLSAEAGRTPAWWGALIATASACASLGACTSTPETSGEADFTPPDEMMTDESLVFEPSTTLTLRPEETATLTVRVTPERRQSVTFELLTEDPEFDGFLSESETQVKEDGTASVTIQAPSQQAAFTVRASLSEELKATRPISVSADGFGTLRVTPRYDGGRDIDQWTASARTDVTCDELDSFFVDGPLAATGSSSATLTDVPAGTVALTVRGGLLVSGCVTVPNLGTDEEESVEIEVSDRPINVQEGTLALSLGVDSTTTDFAASLEEAIASASIYFWGSAETEGAALIDLMAQRLMGDERAEFETAAVDFMLATTVDDVYSGKSPISQTMSDLLTDAASEISGEAVFVGELQLGGDASAFLLSSAAGVPASVSGFFQGSTWMASADSEDTLVLGGALTYEPIRWLRAIANRTAEDPSPGRAVETAANCEAVAQALAVAAGGPTHGMCDESCLQALCEEATSDIWSDLSTAGNGLSVLQVGMSGEAELFGAARVAKMEGSWIGRLENEETSLKGPASATVVAEE